MSAEYSHKLNGVPSVPVVNSIPSDYNGPTDTTVDGPDDSFEVIKVTGIPKTDKWVLEAMYERSLTGKDIYWQVGFDPEGGEMGVLRRWHGQVRGKIQVVDRDVVTNNSGRNIQEQALLEARQQYTIKYRRGYLPAGATEARMIKVMRAATYDPTKPLNQYCYVDTKLNGVRLWARRVGNTVEAFSRGNKTYNFIDHIKKRCAKLLEYLPAHAALDGELFNPDVSFETITSACRKEKTKSPLMHMMEYHIFDVWWEENPPFEVRRQTLERAMELYYEDVFGWKKSDDELTEPENYGTLDSYISGGRPLSLIDPRTQRDYLDDPDYDDESKAKLFMVELHEAYNDEEMQEIYEYFLSIGYEGAMIKRLSNGATPGTMPYKMSQYLFGKGRRVFKIKPAITEEGECVGVTEATGVQKGCAMLDVLDVRGNKLRLAVGSHDQRRHWFRNPKEVIGKAVTFKYGALSSYNVPIFATGVAIRDYEPGFDALNEPSNEDLDKAETPGYPGEWDPPEKSNTKGTGGRKRVTVVSERSQRNRNISQGQTTRSTRRTETSNRRAKIRIIKQ